jgi:putative transcriptional regulator
MARTLRGRLLVATPALGDPNFARTVVLVLEHGPPGAVGLVLNRPIDRPVGEVLPGWSALAAEPDVLFVGGPVEPGGMIALGRVGPEVEAPPGFRPVLDRVGTIDLRADPETAGTSLQAVRTFAGYSGWDSGQLEAELAAEAWYVVRAQGEDVFTADATGLWRAVLLRQRGPLKLVASFPPDPTLN